VAAAGPEPERSVERRRLRAMLTKRTDPYAGADLSAARRLVALLWSLATALTVAMFPLSPPTAAIGRAGWIVALLIVGTSVLGVRLLRDSRRSVSFEQLLVVSVIGLVETTILVWLAGEGSSYQELYLVWIGAGVGVHPPRRGLLFLAAALVLSALPLWWDGWTDDGAREIAAHALLWCAIGAVLMVFIAYTRAQRVELRSGEEHARAKAEAAVKRVLAHQSIAEATRAHMSLSELLRNLLKVVVDAVEAEQGVVMLREPDADDFVLAATTDSDTARQTRRVRLGEGLAGRAASQRRALVEARDGRSAVAVPLIADGSLLGILEVAGSVADRRLTDDDIRLLEFAGERMALAIDRARLHSETRHIAETLQRRLLPGRLPQIPGTELAARYLPGGPGAEVGGDWYDALFHADGRVSLVMGDVVGRGIDAASLMGQLRTAFRAYAIEQPSPGAVLARLNAAFSQFGPEQMATLVLLLFDPESSSICISSAGHPPPLVVAPDGSGSFIEHEHGLPLGVLPYASYSELVVPFEPGSSALLYTDGLVEQRGNIRGGLEALKRAVDGYVLDADGLCTRVVDALLPDGAADDDAAMLAIRNVPLSAERLELRFPAEPAALLVMRRSLGRWLHAGDASARECYELTVACGEACANAIEHAYPPTGGEFMLTALRRNSDIEITVSDSGSWRPRRDDDGGRGVDLIRKLVDDLQIISGSSGTTVTLRRKLRVER
jgi:serine phosphatase RsbU (regulator of sigma subunit)/anti-sigma regulatory factor (Ser/Thr protein kinase)